MAMVKVDMIKVMMVVDVHGGIVVNGYSSNRDKLM